jgi:hypothetical protein
MENTVMITVQLEVQVASYMDEPEKEAERLIREAIAPHVHSEYNWDGRFAIVVKERPPVITTAMGLDDDGGETMRQLTIDGRQEDIPEHHERMKLFEAPKTMRGQLVIPDAETFCQVWTTEQRDAFNREALEEYGRLARLL